MTKFAWLAAIAFGALMAGAATPASAQNCTNQDTLRSPPGATPATEVTFVNAGVESRRIFWIDSNGKRKFYKELGPHASYTQPTFVGHPWIAAREDDRCQTVFVARAKPTIVDVTRSCLTGSINNSGVCVEGAQAPSAPQGGNTSGCQGGTWRGNTCACPRGKTFDAGRCVAAGQDHGGVNCAATGEFYDGISCVKKCPAGTVGRNGMCQ